MDVGDTAAGPYLVVNILTEVLRHGDQAQLVNSNLNTEIGNFDVEKCAGARSL